MPKSVKSNKNKKNYNYQIIKKLQLSDYKKMNVYVNRNDIVNHYITDIHMHFRPFSRHSLPFGKILNYMINNGIIFSTMFGIGQHFIDLRSTSIYYGDATYKPIESSIFNDILNIKNLYSPKHEKKIEDNLVLLPSISCLDFKDPETTENILKYILKKYPNIFKLAGEINMVKQALMTIKPITVSEIPALKNIMKLLEENNLPLLIHCDIGNDFNNFKFKKIIDTFLELYGNQNKIIWGHMGGLSKELSNIDSKKHTNLIQNYLDKYKNLMIGTSWKVCWDLVFKQEFKRCDYVDLINRNPDRFLSGSDFVASSNKTPKMYKDEIECTSIIYKSVNDTAFRNIVLGKNFIDFFKLKGYHVPKLTGKYERLPCEVEKKNISQKCRNTCKYETGC